MDISEIIKDALHYPISDYKKFLILGLPILILSILFFVLIVQAAGLSEISNLPNEAFVNSPLFSTFLITTLIFFVVLIIGGIIIEGIEVSIIRETINNNDSLPSLDILRNFVDGIQCVVLSIIYMGIPAIIYMILLFGLASIGNDIAIILVLLLSVIFIIIMFLVSATYIAALGRFAETNSLSEALQIRKIYETAKTIGLGKIIVVMIIGNILSYVISLIGIFILNIPILGFFIMTYVLYNFYLIFIARSYGLLYRDKFDTNNYNVNYNQNQMNNDIGYNNEYNSYNNNSENIPKNSYDFQPKENDTEEKSSSINLKQCSQCGYSNPDYANICGNCGNKL